jgi:tRNA pseudouridine38-40 synthase
MRIKAVVAYDGTAYHGFQRQAPESEPTIQGQLEAALKRIDQPGGVWGAGRTDSGVHASGQVIAFDVNWSHGLSVLQRALNAVLPGDIAVLELEQSADKFHPRFDALSREYRYRLYTTPIREPLWDRYEWHVPHELDVANMKRAAGRLIGEHDFATFGQPTAGESTVRNMMRAEVAANEVHISIELQANGFLYRMVRRIVGTLVRVGRGEISDLDFAEILGAAYPDRGGQTVPANGLCLTRVNYR